MSEPKQESWTEYYQRVFASGNPWLDYSNAHVQGQTFGVAIEAAGPINGKRCLVIDDICVGGATFIQLGNLLKNGGAKEIALYVSHGIFSKGTDKINLYYNKIYTTNSFDFKKQNPNNDFTGVTVL